MVTVRQAEDSGIITDATMNACTICHLLANALNQFEFT